MGVKKIRVTETRVVEYVPDWNDTFYSNLPEKNLEAAMEVDKEDYAKGDLALDDLRDTGEYTETVTWEIVEVE